MKSSAPDTAKSRYKSMRRSRQTIAVVKEDGPLELVKTKWMEIVEEEELTSPMSIVRAVPTSKTSLSDEVLKLPVLKAAFNEEDLPTDLILEGSVTEREIFKSICNLFSALSSITVLRLIDCKLKAEAIAVLGSSLSDSGTIKELYLDLNPIDGEDFSPLLMNATLEVLSLKGCAISGQGAELISEKLAEHTSSLRVLNLNTNLVDDEGAIAISRSLKWTNKLSCLSLAGNIIGTVGAISLISALKEFTLDQYDLKKRKEILFQRAKLILAIVSERQESYLATLPAMPAIASADFPSTRKSRQKDIKLRKKSETKVWSKSQKISSASANKITSNGDKNKSAVFKKDKGRASEQFSRSRVSLKQPRSSITAVSGSFTADIVSRMDHDGDTDTLDISDDDSISEFSRFDSFIVEDWDRKDNERRYKEKMLKKLCHDVSNELYQDTAFQETILSRVFQNSAGKVCSRGNLELKNLNLAYNKIQQNVIDCVMEMIYYQEKMRSTSLNKKGIRVLILEGNQIPPQQLYGLEIYLKPPYPTKSPSAGTTIY